MLEIRKAEFKDLIPIYNLVQEFYQEALKEYIKVESKTVRKTIIELIDSHIFIVCEKDKKIIGVIGGFIQPSIFDASEKIAQEIIWYVTKKERQSRAGIELFNAFEKECAKLKSNYIIMVNLANLNNDTMIELFKKKNYIMMENQFIRRL